jgi:hypothetical protein
MQAVLMPKWYAFQLRSCPRLPELAVNAPSTQWGYVLLCMLHVAVHSCVLKHLWILLPCEIPIRWLTVTVRNVRASCRTAEYVKSKDPVKESRSRKA